MHFENKVSTNVKSARVKSQEFLLPPADVDHVHGLTTATLPIPVRIKMFQQFSTLIVFVAQVVILEHKSIICAGYSAVLHIHNVVEEVTFVVR